MRRRRQKSLHLVVSYGADHSADPEQDIVEAADRAQSAADPALDLYGLQLQHLLERAVDGLPDSYRATFVLREIEQLSIAETAQALNAEEATVETRVHRARRLLEQQLSDELRGVLGGIYRYDGQRCDRIIARVFERLGAMVP
jgi:RNA polymerase sigma-70 factor, ECF subfamily